MAEYWEIDKAITRMCEKYSCDKCPIMNYCHPVYRQSDEFYKEKQAIIEKWMDENPEPKPCPFCGSLVTLVQDKDCWAIMCLNRDCNVTSKWSYNKNDIIKQWNRRI